MSEKKTLTVELGSRSYPITIGSDLLAHTLEYLQQSGINPSQVFVVTDDVVEPLYTDALCNQLAQRWETELAVIPAGEESKCLDMAQQIWERMLEGGCDRKTLVLAVGGGVVGDLAGFAASTYMRGVAFYQIPTTLLAQVDSSVGGKTAIDLEYGKNVVGTFYQPQGVLIDTDTLKSLDSRQYLAGLGEVVKYGIILDEKFFHYMEGHVNEILARDSETLQEIIFRCCQLKARIVQEDEKELSGRRALLNYGHTFAHAIETFERFSGKLHGEAVSAGMTAAAQFARYLGYITPEVALRHNQLIANLGLDQSWSPNLSPEKTVQIMQRDKKSAGGHINFVLPEAIGSCSLVSDISEEQLLDFLKSLMKQ